MTMLPVCSATTSCSSHSQTSLHGGLLHLSSFQRTSEVKRLLEDRMALALSDEIHLQGVSFKRQAAKYFCLRVNASIEQSPTLDFINTSSYALPESNDTPTTMAVNDVPDNLTFAFEPVTVNNEVLPSSKTNFSDFVAGINESFGTSVNEGQNVLKNSLDSIASSVTSAFKGANDAFDDTVNKVISAADQTGELTVNKLLALVSSLKEASSKVSVVAVDGLRHTIVLVENSLIQGTAIVVDAYVSAKELLPPEIQNILNLSEENAVIFLKPVGTAFQQFYIALEGLEKNLGLDPNDPIVPFVLFFGASASLWFSYRILAYGGYAGDLSPESTLELLTGKENAILIDVRPEDLREGEGIPDLRRTARFRYANIALPKVNGSVRKLLKGGRDVDDLVISAVIRNLKIVQDTSKVIVMDADGTRSKGIARSLRKLGIKRPYLVQGGFRSWKNCGLQIKELKPETALTILNEEAQAFIEDINPTPLKVVGYTMGFFAAVYALLEWERTLRIIGVLGLSQTLYRRISSYEGIEDLKQDVRSLLAPLRTGGQAISWVAGKFETSLNGLPTSPSSSDVQTRVLQAAAKHESQPSDNEDSQDQPSETAAPVSETVDISEA